MADYALIVGCEKFASKLPFVAFAERDCTAFRELLIYNFKIPLENIICLINEDATNDNVNKKVAEISQKLSHGDRVFLYCATHGKTFYDTPFFACYNSTTEEGKVDTWISTAGILYRLSKPQADIECNVLAFLDCCQSTFMCAVRGLDSENVVDFIHPTDGQYVQVFAAAGVNESAFADNEFQHGTWTYYLVHALKGDEPKAFLENTRIITASSLQNYLKDSVQSRIQKTHPNKKQTPYEWGAKSNDITIIDYTNTQGNIPMKISEIYFGEIDTDTELASLPRNGAFSADELFNKNYFDLGNVQKVIDGNSQKIIIAGNKGTGKTYLGEYLQKNNSNVVYFSIGGIPFSKIKGLAPAGEQEKGKYRVAWSYTIYMLMSLYAIQKQIPGCQKLEPVLKLILGEKYSSILANLESRKDAIISKKLKRGITTQDNVLDLEDINWKIEDQLKASLGGNSQIYYFLIDGLDENIRGRITVEQQAQLQDLIDVAQSIEVAVPFCRCILLMREDILKSLGNEANLNKVLTAKTQTLSWLPFNPNGPYMETPLFSFISKRYETSKEYYCKETGQQFQNILPETIKGNRIWPWVLELTTYTPRDVISLFKCCQLAAVNGSTRGNSQSFSEKDFWDALPEYSIYLWREFCDILGGTELSGKGEPLLEILKSIAQSHKVQNESTMRSFQYIEFVREYNRFDSLESVPPTVAVKILYKAGILGITYERSTYWYFRENPLELGDNMLDSVRFSIHKGLWKITRMW